MDGKDWMKENLDFITMIAIGIMLVVFVLFLVPGTGFSQFKETCISTGKATYSPSNFDPYSIGEKGCNKTNSKTDFKRNLVINDYDCVMKSNSTVVIQEILPCLMYSHVKVVGQ